MVEIWERTEKEVYESKSQMIINNSNTFLYLFFFSKTFSEPTSISQFENPCCIVFIFINFNERWTAIDLELILWKCYLFAYHPLWWYCHCDCWSVQASCGGSENVLLQDCPHLRQYLSFHDVLTSLQHNKTQPQYDNNLKLNSNKCKQFVWAGLMH